LEREAKFDVDLDFELPDLSVLFDRVEPKADRQMCTTYYDTADFRLWRRGISLRFRSIDGSDLGIWTVKIPASAVGATLNRTELSWEAHRDRMPPEATGILRGIVRNLPVCELVELAATRRRYELKNASSTTLAEIDDDVVVVRGGTRDGLRFRQIELELRPGGDALLGPTVVLLGSAGAQHGGSQKLALAVDLPSVSDIGTASVTDRHATLAEIVTSCISGALNRLLDHDYRLRLDPLDPPMEDVHQARVATRRLRSDLKFLHSALDPEWVARTRGELKWLGHVLGQVRDDDVLFELLDRDGTSPLDIEGLGQLRSSLGEQRARHCEALAQALGGQRYVSLVERLSSAGQVPPLADQFSATKGSDAWLRSNEPAKRVLPPLVARRWKKLQAAIHRGGHIPTDLQLHRVRIRAKEVRYAAELSTPVIGKAAARTSRSAARVQTVLGEHHDAVAAESWLRAQAARGPAPASYAAGRLAAREAHTQKKLRKRSRAVLAKLDSKKQHGWF